MGAIERRIAAYAVRHWRAVGLAEWPEVRRVARALRIRQSEIESGVGEEYDLETSNGQGQKLGDWFVHAITPDVDREWDAYWRRSTLSETKEG